MASDAPWLCDGFPLRAILGFNLFNTLIRGSHDRLHYVCDIAARDKQTNKQTTWKRAQAEPASMPLKIKLN